MSTKFKPSVLRYPPTTRLVTRETTFDQFEDLLQPHKTFKLKNDNYTDSASVSSEDEYYEYSLGDHDIADLIRAVDLTQLNGAENSSHSNSTSRAMIKEDEENPFVIKVTTKAEDPARPICLSPSQLLQDLFTTKKLPYGAQYEINRLVSVGKLTYDDVFFDDVIALAKMGTNREAAPATARIMLKNSFEVDESDGTTMYKNTAFAKERAAKCPWQELDREEEALQKSPYGGLGFDENNEPLDWHGGRVLFHAKLQNLSSDSNTSLAQFKLTLEPAELSFSHSFARRFGSKHFLRLKLTKPALRNSKQLLDYLRRPFILCGSVFRAFFAKNRNVFYVKTNEGTNGGSILSNAPVPGVMSFLEFINWHNPFNLNSNQTMSKYASRFTLGLSNSVPGIMVNASNLHVIDDIISPIAVGSEPPSNMTDGAGKTNRWTLKRLRQRIDWEDKPTAIQTRVYGAKGLLVEDNKNVDDFSYVELTRSQKKIVYSSEKLPDPAHCIIGVLRSSNVRTPCRLSVETIINLSENGVPKTVFLNLLHQGLKELVEPLLQWDGPDAMRDLWCSMRRIGGVMAARRAREDPGLARVKGYAYTEHGSEECDSDDDDDDDALSDTEEEKSSAWWRDEISGCPSSLEETVMCLIDSGFTPQNCSILRIKLERVIKTHVKNFIKSYRINVPMSASAYLIPDTLGILEPGEIFFKHSKSDFQTLDGLGTDVLLGTVLVTRYPCKLPTDVQKWKAVDKLELHHLVDVVILSTKGKRRAADYLSGGDYDGDRGLVIFQPEVVEAFKEPPEHYLETPPDIENYFKHDKDNVKTFLARVAPLDDGVKIRELQEYLLGAVRDTSVVGKYSNFHVAATYTLGYTHPETIRLAYMFCSCLDGLKTGKIVKDEVLKKDSKTYQKRPPEWKETEEERNQFFASGQNEKNLQRPNGLGRFIMDELYEQAKEEKDAWLAKIESHFVEAQSRWNVKDEDLVAPWNKAVELSRKVATKQKNDWMKRELKKIADHVRTVYEFHRESFSLKKTPRSPSKSLKNISTASVPFTELAIELRQDAIRRVSRKFVSFPPPGEFILQDEEIARLRASYAYMYDYDKYQFIESAGTSFPWDVAMRELGAIKARATGGHKTITGEFYDHFNMKPSKKL